MRGKYIMSCAGDFADTTEPCKKIRYVMIGTVFLEDISLEEIFPDKYSKIFETGEHKQKILDQFQQWYEKIKISGLIVSTNLCIQEGIMCTLIVGPGFDKEDGGRMNSLVDYLKRATEGSTFEIRKCGGINIICAGGNFPQKSFYEMQELLG